MNKLFIASILAVSAAAQPAIKPPQLGFAASADGTLRPVYGIAGNFILGSSVAGKVVSQAFSGSLGLLKTDATLAAFDVQGQVLATTAAADGPALFAFSPDGLTGIAYIASSHRLLEWRAGKFETVPLPARPSALEALFVQRPGVTPPVLALPTGDLVFSGTSGIVLRKPDGSEVHIPASLPAQFRLQQMDRQWVELSDLNSARRFAIRVSPGHEAFYQLPGVGK